MFDETELKTSALHLPLRSFYFPIILFITKVIPLIALKSTDLRQHSVLFNNDNILKLHLTI